MDRTVIEQRKLPGKQKRTEARIERDIAIYRSHMAGNSVRAIQDEFAIKSTSTVHLAISRGKEIVIERGINIEERRIDIDELFKNTLGHLAGEIQRQADEGRIQTIERSDGSREVRRTKGINPRTAEALARSADRWAQFLGITDRGAEVTQATTLINLQPSMDGATFAEQWAQTIDTTASGHESGHAQLESAADPSSPLERPTDHVAVDAA